MFYIVQGYNRWCITIKLVYMSSILFWVRVEAYVVFARKHKSRPNEAFAKYVDSHTLKWKSAFYTLCRYCKNNARYVFSREKLREPKCMKMERKSLESLDAAAPFEKISNEKQKKVRSIGKLFLKYRSEKVWK